MIDLAKIDDFSCVGRKTRRGRTHKIDKSPSDFLHKYRNNEIKNHTFRVIIPIYDV